MTRRKRFLTPFFLTGVVVMILAVAVCADDLVARSKGEPVVVASESDKAVLATFELPAPTTCIEDVIWFETSAFDDEAGGSGDVVLLKFANVSNPATVPHALAGVGPELRLSREGGRDELRLRLGQASQWLDTGARLKLTGSWRLRTRLDLVENEMSLTLRDEEQGVEFSLGSFSGLRVLDDLRPRDTNSTATRLAREVDIAGRVGVRVVVTRWELWSLNTGRLKPHDECPEVDGVLCYVPEGIPSMTGQANIDVSTRGRVLSVRSAAGLREDMELVGGPSFEPADHALRLTGNAFSGNTFLRLQDGPTAIGRRVRVPDGNLEFRMVLRVPEELPRNRHLHLIRLRDPVTGAEPVGPAAYLDYGVDAGHSRLVFQTSREKYISRPVRVEPGVWYELRVKVNRSANTCLAWWGRAGDEPRLLNEDEPAGCFAGLSLPDEVLWQFLSQRTWRSFIDDSGNLKPECVGLWKVVHAVEGAPKPLVIRGYKPSGETPKSWSNARLHLSPDGYKTIVKNAGLVGITPELVPDVGPYRLLMLDGTMHFPYQGDYRLSVKSDGAVFVYINERRIAVLNAPKPGEAPDWQDVKIDAWLVGPSRRFRLVYHPPAGATKPHCEIRWQFPGREPEPIPLAVFAGTEYESPFHGKFHPMRDLTCHDGVLYGLDQRSNLYRFRIDGDRIVLLGVLSTEGDERKHWTARFNLWNITGIAWDESSNGFWLGAPRSGVLLLAKPSLTESYHRTGNYTWRIGCKSLTATPRRLVLVSPDGAMQTCQKYSVMATTVPVDAMLGPGNKLTAVTSLGSDLFVTTSADSTHPNHVFCIDPDSGSVHYAIVLDKNLGEVSALATDGTFLYAAGAKGADFLRIRIPKVKTSGRRQPFLELDDLALVADSAEDAAARSTVTGEFTGPVMVVPDGLNVLEWASWRETAYDSKRGQLELSVRSAAQRYDLHEADWHVLANQKRAREPVSRFLQYRLSIRSDDPWHPPGMHDLILGFTRTTARTTLRLVGKIIGLAVGVLGLAWVVWVVLGKPSLRPGPGGRGAHQRGS